VKAIADIGDHNSIEELEAVHRALDSEIQERQKLKATVHALWEKKQLAKQHRDASNAPSHLNQGIGFPIGGRLG
jgi:ribosome-interacting GTPase 1